MSQEFIWKDVAEGADSPLNERERALLPLTQTPLYLAWQRGVNRRGKCLVLYEGDRVVVYLEYIVYPLLLGKHYIYAPYGPVFFDCNKAIVAELARKSKELLKQENAAFFRLDATIIPNTLDPNNLFQKYFTSAPRVTHSSSYFQPRAEWYCNLEKTENELLLAMHPKTRYSIKLAEKKGIRVEIIERGLDKFFEDFYRLMDETAKRNKFSLHPKAYYQAAFAESEKEGQAFLAVSYFENTLLTIDFHVRIGKTVHFVFGGSSALYRNYCPTYLGKWLAMTHSKKIGATEYNFGGVSLLGSKLSWEGLSSFKMKFGGRAIVHEFFYDCVHSWVCYYAYVIRKFVTAIL